MKQVSKIVLAQPNMKWMDWNWKTSWDIHPLNLCLLAAVIRDGYDVHIVDANLDDLSPPQFKQVIADLEPDLVGLTLLTNEYWKVAHIGVRAIKELDPQIITVIGGVYATVSYKSIYEDKDFDYLCIGEGDQVFPQLLDYLNGRSNFPAAGILGRRAGEHVDPETVKRAPFIPSEQLNALPYPAWDMVDYHRYTNTVGKLTVDQPYNYPYTRLMTSRGCPIGCSFCEVELISGGPFRYRSVENVIGELKWLKEAYGIRAFMMDDDNFFINQKRVKEFCRALIDEKLDLEWKAHAVAVFHMRDDIIELMAQSGCTSIALAIESGNERVLKEIIHKPVKLDRARHIAATIKSHDMDLIANFIIGFPTETWDKGRQTFRFAEEIAVDYAKFFIATPLEGTDLHAMVRESNLLASQSDTTGQMKDLNWSVSQIRSDEWTMEDLTILRAYEWDRINFATVKRREKLAKIMKISLLELEQLRRDTFRSVQDNLHNLRQPPPPEVTPPEVAPKGSAPNTIQTEHHGDHRSPGAESYPGVQLDLAKPVSFGF